VLGPSPRQLGQALVQLPESLLVELLEALPGHAVANSLYGMAPLGYLDSSYLAAGVAKADLPCLFTRQCHQLLVMQAALSQDGTCCAQLLVQGPGMTQGISVEESSNVVPDSSMSGVVAHVKLQLASDSERAAFMREQVRASLPEAEAWRQLLQAEGRHFAGQVEVPVAATPTAQQQQAVSVSAGQRARQQGALPLPAAHANSA
ncbi:hypothetical protein QJQ45_015136, partial [Haematococcus lacustris]